MGTLTIGKLMSPFLSYSRVRASHGPHVKKKKKQSNYEADGADSVVSLISSSLGLIKSSYFEYVVLFRDSTSSIYLCVKLN